MTQIRLNLLANEFPMPSTATEFGALAMTYEEQGSNYQASRITGASFGIPKAKYLHNVLPTSVGYKSVGYIPKTSPIYFRPIAFCNDLMITEKGAYRLNGEQWTQLSGLPNNISNAQVSLTAFRDEVYILIRGVGLFVWHRSNWSIEQLDNSVIHFQTMLGVTASDNYLILWDNQTIYWSSPANARDFTPDLSTGAGSIIPNNLVGSIIKCVPDTQGFLIYAVDSVIKARKSPDSLHPWLFQVIPGAHGIIDYYHADSSPNSAIALSISDQGIQLIDPSGEVSTPFAHFSEFLLGDVFESYIGETGNISEVNDAGSHQRITQHWLSFPYGDNNIKQVKLDGPLNIRVTTLGSRYIAISYGHERWFSSSLIYNSSTKRWGKIDKEHMFMLYFNSKLAIAAPDGTIHWVSEFAQTHDSALFFGEVKHQQGNVISLNSIEAATVEWPQMEAYVILSTDGRTFLPERKATKAVNSDKLILWKTRATAAAIYLKLTGKFNLAGLAIDITRAGVR